MHGRRPQYTSRLCGRCECCQPTLSAQFLWVQQLPHSTYTPAQRDARCRCYETRPDCPRCRGWQTTVHCSGLPLLVAPRWLPLAFTGHKRLLVSSVVCSCLTNGLHCLDPWWRHFMTHKLNAILDCTIPACTFTCAAHLREFLFQHHRLQSFLNAAAKLIRRSSHHEHVTPLLRDLHWLRSWEHIDFKSVMLVYRCLYGLLTISRIISNVSPATIANNFVHHHRHYWFEKKVKGEGEYTWYSASS